MEGKNTLDTFVYIVTNIMMPIFFLLAVGYLGQKKMKMDIKTLTRLNIYIFVPAVLFTKIYETDVTINFFLQMLIYVTIIQILMYLLSKGIGRVLKYGKGKGKAFSNSLMFFNSGNYGIPLIELVTGGNPVAVTSQVFIMLIQNISTNTLGVFQASSGKYDNKQSLKNILTMPSIYMITLVGLVKTFSWNVPNLIMTPLEYISKGFIAIALITLGAQLAEIKLNIRKRDIFVATFTRLILSPLLGGVIVYMMGIKGMLAQALILGVSTPSAVNTALIAREFNNEPEYASQIVFMSTLFSGLTVSLIIYITGKLFV